ncbi:MAG: hypothetical protein IJ881_01425 [Neisseriaceae bacterium]|nr:hypothetical protein [Neisseriaceae bacterium]MBR3425928.1 hypothetical protein [Neisseriaceae bacterium]
MKNTVIIETITTHNGEMVSHSIAFVSPMTVRLYRLLWRGCGGLRKLINRLTSIQAA